MNTLKNGDKVKYRGGLTYTFIGLNPDNQEYAYCKHHSAVDTNSEYSISMKEGRLDLLQIKDLSIIYIGREKYENKDIV